MNQVKIGEFIAQLRKDKNLTQEKLGEKLGITNKTISRWETGIYLPDIEMLQILSKELNVSINEILAGERIEAAKLFEKAEENIVEVLKLVERKSIIGGREYGEVSTVNEDNKAILKTNNRYWNTKGNDFLKTIALPRYGAFLSEDKLNLLGEISDKKVLEIACGNGESLLYMIGQNASELWGVDISENQIKEAKVNLGDNISKVNLVCAPMEEECGVPQNYFDIVYSIYGIGWSTDLEVAFERIYSYLKQNGVFIFSWSHPLHKCLGYENDVLVLKKPYFDEAWYSVMLDDSEINLADRKLSTYINALYKAGFVIEKLIEESDMDIIEHNNSVFSKKAKSIPVTFVIKARKF